MKLFVDLLPGHDAADAAAVRSLGAVLTRERAPDWVVVGSVGQIDEAPPGAPVWIRGSEAADPGEVTALILIRAAVRSGRRWVVEGIGLRASAAALAIGAEAAVIDVAAWVTDGSPLDSGTRDALVRARSGRDTVVEAGRRVLRGAAIGAPQSVVEARRGSGRSAAALVREVRAELDRLLLAIRADSGLHSDPLGAGGPIVQGPMANIAEGSGLALAVSRAGATPFAALGALDSDQATSVLTDFASGLAGRPWGVGVIGFEMMPHRDAHLAAIRALGDRRPGYVILAGASAALALEVQAGGPEAWLHTPSAALAGQAIDRGVRGVVFEGHEAGGHVGSLTSVGAWEEGLAVVEQRGVPVRAVLAGGIGDPASAAFAAAMGAGARQVGATVLLQAGTAFLFTHEVVEAGQLTAAGQQAALAATETVLVGATVNLPLRVVPNAYSVQAITMEQGWLQEGLPLAERRARMEHHNLGRTRIGAKGLVRNPDYPDQGARYRLLSTRRQRDEGAFSVGQGAVLTAEIQTVRELVTGLTDRAHSLLNASQSANSWPGGRAVIGAPKSERIRGATGVQLGGARAVDTGSSAIAIVGLGCVLPDALDVPSFWRNLLEGHDAIGAIPDARWPAHRYWDPDAGSTGPVKSASRHAGMVRGFVFDHLRYRIPPRVLETLDPSQRLALVAADQAVTDAGWHGPGFDRRRAAVILGNAMGGEYSKSMALRVRFREVLAALEAEGAVDGLSEAGRDELFARIEARIAADLPPVEVDSMAGLLSNVVAGRVASWLDWMGGNLTVDAACAASLASVAVAVDWLRAGRCDAVLAGGVDTDLSPESYVGFSRTHALSRTGSSPFSSRADGFVMGEGAAVLALRRLDDAVAAGEPIWAVIRGVGQSSDGRGRGITAPRAEGQRLALERAWAESGVAPDRIELVEAHGTGTAVGDATEVGVLTELLGQGERRAWLGSVKSMIGHLKGAAGAAGMLKTTLSLATRTALPTLHAAPLADYGLDATRIRLPRSPVRIGTDAAATVSAFGFGGTNFHVVLTGPPEGALARSTAGLVESGPLLRPDSDAAWLDVPAPLLVAYGASTAAALLEAVLRDRPEVPSAVAMAEHRLVLLTQLEDRDRTVAKVGRWLESGGDGALGNTAFTGRGPAEPVVVLAPGQGAQHGLATHALSRLPAGARAHEAVAVAVDPLASDPLSLHRALVPVAVGWAAWLDAAEVPVGAALGHSLGELGALVAAGRLTPAHAMGLAEVRGQALAETELGAMLAVALDEAGARRAARAHGLTLAAVNAPQSSVLAGPTEAVERASAALSADGVRCVRLEVERAFHTPSTQPAAHRLAHALASVPFQAGAPTWSGATAAPMEDPGAALGNGIPATVRFADALRSLWSSGHRQFVELGPGNTLTGLVRATLPDALVIALDPAPGDGLRGTAIAAAALLAAGHPGPVSQIPATWLTVALPGPTPAPPRRPQRVGAGAVDAAPLRQPEPSREREVDAQAAELTTEDPVRSAVIAAICDVTGYPPEFIEGDAELEAELGVDSIRKLEVLGQLEDRLGFRATEADYGVLERANVDRLTAFVQERLNQPNPVVAKVESRVSLWVFPPHENADNNRESYAHGLTVPVDGHWQVRSPPPGLPLLRVHAAVRALREAVRLTPPTGLTVHFTPGDPASAAALGFCRSLALERGIPLDVHPVGGPLVRFEPEGPAPVRPVIYCTGGLAGILGPIVEALDDLDPVVVVFGRTPSTCGLAIHAYPTDLADWDGVRACVSLALTAHGPPDLVLHAAGALADGPAHTRTDADQAAVFGPKVDALAHLAAALPGPTRWLLFSSVAALEGNPSQTLYTAANLAMHHWPLPGASAVALTAWSQRGMAADPALQRALERRGITAIAPSDGALAMRTLVVAALAGELPREVALLGQEPEGAALPWPLHSVAAWTADSLRLRVRMSPLDPALDAHRVGGKPLVPAAVWLQAILGAIACRHPDWTATTVHDLHMDLPTFVERPREDLAVLLDANGAHVFAGETRVGGALFRAGSGLAAGRRPLALPDPEAAPYAPESLFHGPHWQVLERVQVDAGQAAADLRHTDPAGWIDGAHQLLALWAGRTTGWLTLPTGAAAWELHSRTPQPGRLTLEPTQTADGASASVRVVGLDGTVLLVGRGVRSRRATPWPEPADV